MEPNASNNQMPFTRHTANHERTPHHTIRDIAPAAPRTRLWLLEVAGGNQDGLLRTSRRVNKMLNEHELPHDWRFFPAAGTLSRCGRAT